MTSYYRAAKIEDIESLYKELSKRVSVKDLRYLQDAGSRMRDFLWVIRKRKASAGYASDERG